MLNNAIRQLEGAYYMAFTTSLPAGMFGDEHPSALWKPSLYLRSAEVKNSMDVFGFLFRAEEVLGVAPNRLLPIRQTTHHHADMPSHLTRDFEETFREISSAGLAELLATVYESWDFSNTSSLAFVLHGLIALDDDFGILVIFLGKRYASRFRDSRNRKRRNHPDRNAHDQNLQVWFDYSTGGKPTWPRGRDVDHCWMIHNIVCAWLGVKPELARQNNLRVMVHLGTDTSPPRLGLNRMNIGSGDHGFHTTTIRNFCHHCANYMGTCSTLSRLMTFPIA